MHENRIRQYFAKVLFIIGIIIIFTAVILHFRGNKFNWLGRLPGDIHIEKKSYKVYIPIVSFFILSVFLILIINLIKRFFNN